MYKYMVAIALAFALAGTARANLIVNGGFEAPDVATGSFQIFNAITGWSSTTIGGGIEVQDHVAGDPFEGQQHVELDSYLNSNMISQTVATVAGASYDLSFAYSARPNVSAGSNGIEVYFNGLLLASITAAGGATTNWAVYNYVVVATGNTSALEFRATGNSDRLGGYLDDVQLNDTVVPEPATLTLFGLGLGLAGMMKARRKK